MATAEFSKFAGILSASLSQHHLSGFETAQLEFHHLHLIPNNSVGRESACNAGDPGSIPGSGISFGKRERLPTPVFLGFPYGSAGKESACSAEDLGSVLGSRRSLGEGNSSILAWRIPRIEEPGELQSTGLQRVRQTRLSN